MKWIKNSTFIKIIVDKHNKLCQDEIQRIKDEISSCEAERRELKAIYFDLLNENMKKDVQIEEMEKKIRPKIYNEFAVKFPIESMEKLRSIGLEQEQDSLFMHAVVRGLYEGNINVLSSKTTTGRSKDKTKEPISPKKDIMTKIFNERIETTANAEERQIRKKN